MATLSDWRLDLGHTKGGSSNDQLNPPGYSTNVSISQHRDDDGDSQANRQESLVMKRAWEVAMGPAKSLPTNMFMMYMIGNGLSIYTIMMLGMVLWRPVQALFSVNAAFRSLVSEECGPLLINKFFFILGNVAAIALAVYKVHTMGLLPNTPSDWLEFVPPMHRLQYAFTSPSFV